ncbi:M14 family metallopeptidase [Pedobacter sp. BS3]|uniref:M14 family metallopeptidase n=1 Tax=Pedobacter sp. BS3 TaxID=2567937 RepID=UPI001658F1AC|nr:M14 family metallopeptidase [Pedobacter sp. BS3]
MRKQRVTAIAYYRLSKWLLSLLVCVCYACSVPRSSVSTTSHPAAATINFQDKREYGFNDHTVTFSNRFASARLNNVKQLNDSTFAVVVLPENSPINASPWYAFKLWASHKKNIYIHLTYPDSRHRYDPKVSYSGKSWTPVSGVKLNSAGNDASFKVEAGADTLIIAAQEIIDSSTAYRWIDSVAQKPFIKKQVIGQSILGKPIIALHTTESPGKKLVVVLSRQHPPEVTGFMAMQEFVKTVLAATPLAEHFRKSYEVIMVPLINPDGVDEGNWRHSTAGVDLNRDWTDFKQPETRAVKDYLLNVIAKQQAKAYFGIDFHSTYQDVFYINEDKNNEPTNLPGFTRRWLEAFEAAIPGFKANVRPSGNGGNVSKSWMGRVLKAEALTYEVGDNTPRSALKQKGRVAAETMMELLLKEKML